MAKFELIISDEAQEDYLEILGYLVGVFKSEQAASNFELEFLHSFNFLRDAADTYPVRYVINQKRYCRVDVRNYTVIFRVDDERVYIIRIFHGSQDIENKLES